MTLKTREMPCGLNVDRHDDSAIASPHTVRSYFYHFKTNGTGRLYINVKTYILFIETLIYNRPLLLKVR